MREMRERRLLRVKNMLDNLQDYGTERLHRQPHNRENNKDSEREYLSRITQIQTLED